MSSPLEPPLAPLKKAFIFKDVPWLGGKHDGYPLVPFKDYTATRPKSSSISTRELAAELQSQLTFGFLEGVMEVKIPESKLLRINCSGSQVMTSENLAMLLHDWRNRIRKCGNGEPSQQWYDRVQTTFKQVRGILIVEVLKPQYGLFWRAGLRLRGLVDILLQIGSLAEAVLVSSYAFPLDFPYEGWSFAFILALAQEQTADMVANGWCPCTVKILSDNLCVLGYAGTCRPPLIREDSSEGHGKCTSKQCVLNTTDTSNYKPKHVVETCNCDMIKPDLAKVVDLLAIGKIPIVQCPAPQDKLDSYDSSEMPYIAISHVWADGLRSTTEDGLPTCQIKRIIAMASQLIPSGAFWIDTLCIPKIPDIRTRAIDLMAQTYKEALAVLVLDAGIREISRFAPREEKMMRVLCSAWMQRLWTLQEGLLAQKLYFEFSDGVVHLEELFPMGEEQYNTLVVQLATPLLRLTRLREGSEFRIVDVTSFLRYRATSNASDETLAIAGLLNVGAGKLSALHPDERMQSFLLSIHKIPSNVIFLSGDKLNAAGFRWAPKTFLQGVEVSLNFGASEALCTSTGLVAEYTAIYFKPMVIPLDGKYEKFCICDSSKQRIYVVTETRLETEAVDARHVTCNALLLMKLPVPLETTISAAVLVEGAEVVGDGDRMLCEFKEQFLLSDITKLELNKYKGLRIVNAKSKRMRVKVV